MNHSTQTLLDFTNWGSFDDHIINDIASLVEAEQQKNEEESGKSEPVCEHRNKLLEVSELFDFGMPPVDLSSKPNHSTEDVATQSGNNVQTSADGPDPFEAHPFQFLDYSECFQNLPGPESFDTTKSPHSVFGNLGALLAPNQNFAGQQDFISENFIKAFLANNTELGSSQGVQQQQQQQQQQQHELVSTRAPQSAESSLFETVFKTQEADAAAFGYCTYSKDSFDAIGDYVNHSGTVVPITELRRMSHEQPNQFAAIFLHGYTEQQMVFEFCTFPEYAHDTYNFRIDKNDYFAMFLVKKYKSESMSSRWRPKKPRAPERALRVYQRFVGKMYRKTSKNASNCIYDNIGRLKLAKVMGLIKPSGEIDGETVCAIEQLAVDVCNDLGLEIYQKRVIKEGKEGKQSKTERRTWNSKSDCVKNRVCAILKAILWDSFKFYGLMVKLLMQRTGYYLAQNDTKRQRSGRRPHLLPGRPNAIYKQNMVTSHRGQQIEELETDDSPDEMYV